MRPALFRLLRLVLSVFPGSFLVASSAMATITLVNGPNTYVTSYAQKNANGLDQQGVYLTTVPDSGTVTSVNSPSTSTTNYDLSNSEFLFTFDHHRGSEDSARAESFVSIYFTPSSDVNYVISGAYAAADSDG